MFKHSLKHLKSVVDRDSFHDPYLGFRIAIIDFKKQYLLCSQYELIVLAIMQLLKYSYNQEFKYAKFIIGYIMKVPSGDVPYIIGSYLMFSKNIVTDPGSVDIFPASRIPKYMQHLLKLIHRTTTKDYCDGSDEYDSNISCQNACFQNGNNNMTRTFSSEVIARDKEDKVTLEEFVERLRVMLANDPPWKFANEYRQFSNRLKPTWKVMEALVESCLVRAIGVSSFSVRQIEELLQFANIVPAVNQVELHPFMSHTPLGVLVSIKGMSDSGSGSEDEPRTPWIKLRRSKSVHSLRLKLSVVAKIAERHKKTPGHIIL
ncbi:hypothetical protein GIB67_039425 [Kingdonia uniflora]|uniref:NADP-dependent oxidoreductase domain-containing protein n=1 Tax=Kingdonia uniflora TaxID=39325 RepID=A0A7J7LIF7_9MAGN|nr:hypothetical protein GIB67_039425 [Kingdonia uniflora]